MSVWTQDRIEHLKQAWPLGQSADVIARDLGDAMTRHAVLSKVRRLGLSRPGQTQPPSKARGDQGEAPSHGIASIVSVRRADCRWPDGDPVDVAFSLCGRPSTRGAYCAAHAAMAYRAAPQSIESLMRLVGIGP